jgi:hypothetical protein
MVTRRRGLTPQRGGLAPRGGLTRGRAPTRGRAATRGRTTGGGGGEIDLGGFSPEALAELGVEPTDEEGRELPLGITKYQPLPQARPPLSQRDLPRFRAPTFAPYYSRDLLAPQRWTSPARLLWQNQMIAAGLLDPDDMTPGVWDAATQKAYKKVLEYANAAQITKDEAMAELAANPSEATLERLAEEAAGPPVEPGGLIRLSDPTDLKESFRDTYQSRVGRYPDERALSAFVETYHNLERQGGQREIAAQEQATTTGQDVEYTLTPGMTDAAKQMIRERYGAEENAYQTIVRYQDWLNMLESPVQGIPG